MDARALEREIDRLYQLPLPGFTEARNGLAKQAGAESGRVRGLVKPPVAAWADIGGPGWLPTEPVTLITAWKPPPSGWVKVSPSAPSKRDRSHPTSAISP